MLTKPKVIASLAVNLFIFVVTAVIVVSYFFEKPSELMRHGSETFRFFTTDSNILAAICSLAAAVCEGRILLKKTDALPKAAVLLKCVGTVSVMLTFCTTVFFLVPVYGPALLLGKYTIVHVATPLLSLVSFAVLETVYPVRFRFVPLAIIPMAIYGIVYLTEVVVIGEQNGGWRDFYAFNRTGQWYLTGVIMLAAVFVIACLTALFHNAFVKRSASAK